MIINISSSREKPVGKLRSGKTNLIWNYGKHAQRLLLVFVHVFYHKYTIKSVQTEGYLIE